MAGAKFEIQIKNGTRWSLHSYKPNQEEAVAEARKLLKQGICEAAQVLLQDDFGEKTVFSEDANLTQKKAGINHVTDAPLCNQVEDLYSEEIQVHLAAGKQVKKLGVLWKDALSCIIDDDLTIKRLKFQDMVLEKADDGDAESAADQFDQDFTVMSLELSRFFKSLFKAFGGMQRKI